MQYWPWIMLRRFIGGAYNRGDMFDTTMGVGEQPQGRFIRPKRDPSGRIIGYERTSYEFEQEEIPEERIGVRKAVEVWYSPKRRLIRFLIRLLEKRR